MQMQLPTSSELPGWSLEDHKTLMQENYREWINQCRKEQEIADSRIEKWLDRCDRYHERMKS